jgi:hypothetical protein
MMTSCTSKPSRVAAVGVALLMAGGGARAAEGPRLPLALASSANPLQRAAWTCEGGAPALAAGPNPSSSARRRFFLSGAGAAGAAEAPLVLAGAGLSGMGRMAEDTGWSLIRFKCLLSPDLRTARAFLFTVVGKAPVADAPEARAVDKTWASTLRWDVDVHQATLTHGVPETDDRDFRADCTPRSGRVSVHLTHTPAWLKKDGYVLIGLQAGNRSGLYVARGVLNDESGAYMPELSIGAEDPLLGDLAAGKVLAINVGRDLAYNVDLAGAAPSVRTFAAACRR